MTRLTTALGERGVRAALASAGLFGIATPLAAVLLGSTSPWLLAGLLYLGAGIGLTAARRARGAPRVRLPRADVPWLAAAIACGGLVAPVLLMAGLTAMPASSASLLLTSEGAFTAIIAWVVFRENVNLRVGGGYLAILLAALVLAWPVGDPGVADGGPTGAGATGGSLLATAAVLGSCLLWAVDNNLTRRVSLHDATWLAALKGWTAGGVNLALALAAGAVLPAVPVLLAAGTLGLVSYGVSLALFVVALRHLGTARASAYFSAAPFVGATLAVALGDPVTWQLLLGGGLMAVGVLLHLTERHEHEHTHPAVLHSHPFGPDVYHAQVQVDGRLHEHPRQVHTHRHYPDSHHQHGH